MFSFSYSFLNNNDLTPFFSSHQHRLTTLLRGFAGTQGEVTPKMLQQCLTIVGVPVSNTDVKKLLTSIDPTSEKRKTANTLMKALDASSLAVADDPDIRRRGVDRVLVEQPGSHAVLSTHINRKPAGVSVHEYEIMRSGSQPPPPPPQPQGRQSDRPTPPTITTTTTNINDTIPPNSPSHHLMESKVRQMVEDSIVAQFRDHHGLSADFPSTNRKKRSVDITNGGARHNDSTRMGLELGHVLNADNNTNNANNTKATGSSPNRLETKNNRNDVGIWSSELSPNAVEERLHKVRLLHTGKKEPDWKHDTCCNETGRRMKNNLTWSESRQEYETQKSPLQLKSGKKTFIQVQEEKRVQEEKHHHQQPTAKRSGSGTKQHSSPRFFAAGLSTVSKNRVKKKTRIDPPVRKSHRQDNIITHRKRSGNTSMLSVSSSLSKVNIPNNNATPPRRAMVSPTRILHLSSPPPVPSSGSVGL